MNCRNLGSDVLVNTLQQLVRDRSIDAPAVQEHRSTALDVHGSLLLYGWQFLLSETTSPGVGGIGFLLPLRAVKVLPTSPSPVIILERLYWMSVTDVFTHSVKKITDVRQPARD